VLINTRRWAEERKQARINDRSLIEEKIIALRLDKEQKQA
jgi:hypothetical protein